MRLPSTLKRIEYDAFRDCKKLKRIRLPDSLETIRWGCFASSGLEEIVLPKSVKNVASVAFGACEQLQHVQLNEGLEKFGEKETI